MIDSQPENFYGNIGDEISFSVEARGEGLTYQWQVSGSDGLYWSDSGASGYNTPTIYGFDVTTARYGKYYRCQITDTGGNVVYSQPGQIRGDVPAVTKQPEDVQGFLGEAISFTVETWGEGLTYQWQVSGNDGLHWSDSAAPGYNTPTIYGFDITAARDGKLYRCKITDSSGNVAYSEPGEIILATKAWNFTYNADGMRTKRTDGLSTYTYVYNGGQLSQMTKGTDTLRFTYGATGAPMALTYNGTYYYYVTNLQGDVIAILNNAGTVVTEYTYDAWGNPISTTGTMADTLGKLNPLRYRGYVYDEETGLYYLQSRYYDAEVGRWINADKYVSTGRGMLGYNMFAYCNNNPVMYSDVTGEFPWLAVLVVAVCAVVGGVLGWRSESKLGAKPEKVEEPLNTKPPTPNQNKNLLPDDVEEEGQDISPQSQDKELTTVDRIKNAAIGAGLGVVVGGAIVATVGAAGSVAAGSASAYIGAFGGTGAQTFSIGAAVYDIASMILFPFFGIEAETIEIEP